VRVEVDIAVRPSEHLPGLAVHSCRVNKGKASLPTERSGRLQALARAAAASTYSPSTCKTYRTALFPALTFFPGGGSTRTMGLMLTSGAPGATLLFLCDQSSLPMPQSLPNESG
jgi:hypothetical protein